MVDAAALHGPGVDVPPPAGGLQQIGRRDAWIPASPGPEVARLKLLGWIERHRPRGQPDQQNGRVGRGERRRAVPDDQFSQGHPSLGRAVSRHLVGEVRQAVDEGGLDEQRLLFRESVANDLQTRLPALNTDCPDARDSRRGARLRRQIGRDAMGEESRAGALPDIERLIGGRVDQQVHVVRAEPGRHLGRERPRLRSAGSPHRDHRTPRRPPCGRLRPGSRLVDRGHFDDRPWGLARTHRPLPRLDVIDPVVRRLVQSTPLALARRAFHGVEPRLDQVVDVPHFVGVGPRRAVAH